MSKILIDDVPGWFDPGPIEDTDVEILYVTHQPLPPEAEAARLQGLQDAWDCPQRGPERRKAASERMRLARQSNTIPQPSHSDERRAQTSERMKQVWADRRKARTCANPSPQTHKDR